jgi:hypothetical protein
MKKATVVSAALFAAWTLHDVEEVATEARNSAALARRAPAWLPIPPDVRRDGFSQRQVNTAAGLMGVFMGAAALDGIRSGGRSWFYQTVLRGFGWHGIGHLAATAATGQYTSGVVTAPVLVIPYWLWARRELAREGVPMRPVDLRAMAAMYPILIAVHAIARAINGDAR